VSVGDISFLVLCGRGRECVDLVLALVSVVRSMPDNWNVYLHALTLPTQTYVRHLHITVTRPCVSRLAMNISNPLFCRAPEDDTFVPGLLCYLMTVICHFLSPLRSMCGQWAEWATLI
jgi:hypothetical protein